MKNQDLDNFFKSKSNSFDEMPSDDLWKKIQNNLSQEPKPKSNFKKPFLTMVLPIITLLSVTTLILNSNNNTEKTDKTILSKDSVKKEKIVVFLDTNAKLKSSLPILDLKTTSSPAKSIAKSIRNTTIIKDSVLTTKQDFKTKDAQEKLLLNDSVKTTQILITHINKLGANFLNFRDETIHNEKNATSFKEGKPQTKEIRAVIPEEDSNFQEKIYSMDEVAVKPKFSDGINQLYLFIQRKYRTPKDCPGGRVTITFVIEKDGSLTNIKTLKDIGFGAGEEAVRVLKESPKWISGKHDGKIVRVQYTLPITIEAEEGLDNKDKLIIENDTQVWSMAGINVKPEFIGGIGKLHEFIAQNYKTPKDCPGGKITLNFIVEKEGSISNIKYLKDAGFGSGEEAIRVIKKSPKWEPGEQNGKKVRVLYNLTITVKPNRELEEYDLVYNAKDIEQKPEFIGGMEKLYRFIGKNYKVPKDCPGGKIFLSFIVEKDGSLSDIKKIRDIGFGTGEEAVRVLKECPNWIPAEQNGKKIRVLFNLPITIQPSEN